MKIRLLLSLLMLVGLFSNGNIIDNKELVLYFSIYSNRVIRQVPKHENWQLEWVIEDDVISGNERRKYLTWLKTVKSELNPDDGEQIVYYPGIGAELPDLISPLLATGYTKLYSVDYNLAEISYGVFKRSVSGVFSSAIDSGKIKDLVFFKEDSSSECVDIFGCRFKYKGIERVAKVYYGLDSQSFIPPELNKYDTLYTRYSPGIISFNENIEGELFNNLRLGGHVITDDYCTLKVKDEAWRFLQKFSEVQILIEVDPIRPYLFEK